jgi:hypothetical protein
MLRYLHSISTDESGLALTKGATAFLSNHDIRVHSSLLSLILHDHLGLASLNETPFRKKAS